MAIRQQTITAEGFLELVEQPAYEDRVLELVEGAIVEMSKPTMKHGVITMRLAMKIANHVEANDLGVVTAADTGFILQRNPHGRDTVRGLDIAFVSKSRAPEPLEFTWYETGPDLAVEVISPNHRAGDIHVKVMQLLNAGTRLVWLIYPESRTVESHTAGGATAFRQDDTLSGGDVLPGFELPVSDIFPS